MLTVPFPLRFPLAFDGELLGQVLRIFTDTIAAHYRKRQAQRGIADGQSGAVTVIQRANSDLRLNPHFHVLQLDGLYSPAPDGAPIFHPVPSPTQQDVEAIVERASKRILRFLQRRGVITLVTAPGDGEVTVVCDETLGDQDPLLARLLAAATAGESAPTGPRDGQPTLPTPRASRSPVARWPGPQAQTRAHRARPRRPPGGQGQLMQSARWLQLAWRDSSSGPTGLRDGLPTLPTPRASRSPVANDKKGRETLCKYILRPPLANDRLHILPNQHVRLEFKRPWSDGTSSIDLEPLALIARLAALVPPPRRHVVRYSGVLSSHSRLRSQIVPAPRRLAPEKEEDKPSRPLSHYISWHELLKRTFQIDITCFRCQSPLRLIALHKTADTIKKILSAMKLPVEAPKLYPARPPPAEAGGEGGDWLN